MQLHVVVIGGGVAGMTAAHELIERGFQVTILERDAVPGGKARTHEVPAPIVGGNRKLPGEHGFRFFPHFYQHLDHTMGRIPLAGGRWVVDNLTPATHSVIARTGKPPIEIPIAIAGSSATLTNVFQLLRSLFEGKNTGLTPDDFWFFSQQVFKIMRSCEERALDKFESESWWKFMDADNPQKSDAFRTYLVEGLTRCLVAAKAKEANVRAGGVVLTQLFYGLMAGASVDRVLNGPTGEAWLDPWLAYLMAEGVNFRFNARVTDFTCAGNEVQSVTFVENGVQQQISGDYYIGALPIEVMQKLWSPTMRALDPNFAADLDTLAPHPAWMTGIQYFLNADHPVTHGHITFVDSPWALTAISQPQFWPNVDLTRYGDGSHLGIISVDISEWDTPGVSHPTGPTFKTAKQCTRDEIARDVWQQMINCLNVAGYPFRLPATWSVYFLDPNIEFDQTQLPIENHARLFVNKINSWERRPKGPTPLENLFLASDYIQTNTNLATMEAACEAARISVQFILSELNMLQNPCETWPLPFPPELNTLRVIDKWWYDRGL